VNYDDHVQSTQDPPSPPSEFINIDGNDTPPHLYSNTTKGTFNGYKESSEECIQDPNSTTPLHQHQHQHQHQHHDHHKRHHFHQGHTGHTPYIPLTPISPIKIESNSYGDHKDSQSHSHTSTLPHYTTSKNNMSTPHEFTYLADPPAFLNGYIPSTTNTTSNTSSISTTNAITSPTTRTSSLLSRHQQQLHHNTTFSATEHWITHHSGYNYTHDSSIHEFGEFIKHDDDPGSPSLSSTSTTTITSSSSPVQHHDSGSITKNFTCSPTNTNINIKSQQQSPVNVPGNYTSSSILSTNVNTLQDPESQQQKQENSSQYQTDSQIKNMNENQSMVKIEFPQHHDINSNPIHHDQSHQSIVSGLDIEMSHSGLHIRSGIPNDNTSFHSQTHIYSYPQQQQPQQNQRKHHHQQQPHYSHSHPQHQYSSHHDTSNTGTNINMITPLSPELSHSMNSPSCSSSSTITTSTTATGPLLSRRHYTSSSNTTDNPTMHTTSTTTTTTTTSDSTTTITTCTKGTDMIANTMNPMTTSTSIKCNTKITKRSPSVLPRAQGKPTNIIPTSKMDRKTLKRLRNRVSASRCRIKKKVWVHELEEQYEFLHEERQFLEKKFLQLQQTIQICKRYLNLPTSSDDVLPISKDGVVTIPKNVIGTIPSNSFMIDTPLISHSITNTSTATTPNTITTTMTTIDPIMKSTMTESTTEEIEITD